MTSNIKILAIDDEEFNLDIISECLSHTGYEVILAEDGYVGLQKLSQNPGIAVIVLDRIMPRMGGMEFLKQVKSDPRFRDIPVILQTIDGEEQIREGMKHGIYKCLIKPYADEELVKMVKDALCSVKKV